MKTTMITIASILATLATVSMANATASQTPGFLIALNEANSVNRAGSAVYDPNCDDAKVWDAKWVDDDGDGVPDVDPVRSEYAFVARVNNNAGKRVGSAFAVGKRHVVTAAHVFAEGGRELETRKNPTINIEGCPGETYKVVRKHVNSLSPEDDMVSDYAVLELDREMCKGARGLVFGAPAPEELQGVEVIASGFYSLSDFKNSNVGDSRLTGANPSESGKYKQYSDNGPIVKSIMSESGQLLFTYQVGQTFGGSGGPIVTQLEGRTVVVGMQYEQPDDDDMNFNFGLGTRGNFFDYVQGVVGEDLVVYQSGSQL